MVKEYEEIICSQFEGTIIDIETIGEFDRFYRYDSRQYKNIVQVILGYINQERLYIYRAKNKSEILQLKKMTREIIKNLKRPFYAFNCEFETGVLFHNIGIEVIFDGELNSEKYESKRDAVRKLQIPNNDDPFFDEGIRCMKAWHDGKFDSIIAHNRACLLKERDILIHRGHREPNKLVLSRKED